uniref:Glucosidase 2 subunit beta n=1 Tax=Ceratitis capitata TaxID=7213 RepID=W8CAD4_CERCA
MRKTWVKRENIYYKPFYKQKSKMFLLGVFLLGIVFIIYQAFSINQLPSASTPWSFEGTMQGLRKKHMEMIKSLGRKQSDGYDDGGGGGDGALSLDNNEEEDSIKIIRGIRLYDYDSYKPNFDGNFRCLDGSKEVSFKRVNDDFCDCLSDGSDEPSNNACAKGRFYCKYQKRHITGRGVDVYVPSSRINDGICDCCDGSDEWLTITCKNKCT